MVAVIKSGASLSRTYHYNENKVKDGVARCFMAQNYPLDLEDLDERMRLNMLLKVADRNPDLRLKSVHISLNFAPGEQLSTDQLCNIATEYMDTIGFGEQPFLAYEHYDAGHPHIHIVTTKVRADGTTIDMFNIGRNQSEKARKAIELRHGLVRAEDHKGKVFRLPSIDAGIIEYGRPVTKRAITNVLDAVLERYLYTSLPELNAVLNRYNVSAEQGSEGTRTYAAGGLVYRVIDKDGYPVSAPIKASAFYNKPTLKYLEKRFANNAKARLQFKTRVMNRIDMAFIGGAKPDLKALSSLLKKDGIDTVFRFSVQGQLYGVTYVDHRNKCVFNGSSLGADYSAKAISERCAPSQSPVQTITKEMAIQADQLEKGRASLLPNTAGQSLWDQLTEVQHSNEYIPFELSGKKRNKKKRKSRTF